MYSWLNFVNNDWMSGNDPLRKLILQLYFRCVEIYLIFLALLPDTFSWRGPDGQQMQKYIRPHVARCYLLLICNVDVSLSPSTFFGRV